MGDICGFVIRDSSFCHEDHGIECHFASDSTILSGLRGRFFALTGPPRR